MLDRNVPKVCWAYKESGPCLGHVGLTGKGLGAPLKKTRRGVETLLLAKGPTLSCEPPEPHMARASLSQHTAPQHPASRPVKQGHATHSLGARRAGSTLKWSVCWADPSISCRPTSQGEGIWGGGSRPEPSLGMTQAHLSNLDHAVS